MAFPFRENNDDLSAALAMLKHDKLPGHKLQEQLNHFIKQKGSLFESPFSHVAGCYVRAKSNQLPIYENYIKDEILPARYQLEITCKEN